MAEKPAGRPVRKDKVEAVAALSDRFRASSATVLTEYRGLTVADLQELRRGLGDGTTYTVTKNTLAMRAATAAGIDGIESLFTGPTALTFVAGDPVQAAKNLRDFGRSHPALVIKGGVFEGRPISADDVRRLADLESRDVLLARLAGGMKATMSRAAAVLQAPLSKTARLAVALRDKRDGESGGEGGTEGAG